jgi:hypothetical protein
MKAIVPIVAALIVVAAFSQSGHQPPQHVPVSVVTDWTARHAIFPDIKDFSVLARIQRDPRYWHQWYQRHWGGRLPGGPSRDARASHRDWSVLLGGGAGTGNTYPAKFSFDVTATPDCTKDFVVTGVNIAGSGPTGTAGTGQANLVGLNNLYVNSGGTGHCSGTAPNFIFAYNVGDGSVFASVVMSEDGKKLAFIENGGTGGTTPTYFHVLTIGTTGSNGTDGSHPAVPGTGNNAQDLKVELAEPGTMAPFVDYTNDVAYLTTYNDGITTGTIRKISPVFRSTSTNPPVEATTGGWPVASTYPVSTPVFDSLTGRLFFKNTDGQVRYIDTTATSVGIATASFAVTSGADAPARPVIVDSTNARIYAYSSGATGTHCAVGEAHIDLTSGVTASVGSVTSDTAFAPSLNNAYYTGSSGAYLYAVGNDGSANMLPALYRVALSYSATTGWTMSGTAANGPLLLVETGAAAGISASPLTEFYNTWLGDDFLFSGITNNCSTAVTGGCARSFNLTTLTSGFPTTTTVNNTILAASGGSSGITVDNIGSLAEESSAYYVTLGATYELVKATQSGLD